MADKYATFARIMDGGRLIKVVVLSNDGRYASVRPIHQFNRVIACSSSDLFPLTDNE